LFLLKQETADNGECYGKQCGSQPEQDIEKGWRSQGDTDEQG
jgi:hypothetical protein